MSEKKEQIINAYREKVGGEPTLEEIRYIDRWASSLKGEDYNTIAGALGAIYKGLDKKIDQTASASGVKVNDQQKQAIRRNIFDTSAGWSPTEGANRDAFINSATQLIVPALQTAYQQGRQNPTITDQHSAALQDIFQSTLGRAPTQYEIEHFGRDLANKDATAYDVQQYLQQTPEYQKIQANQENERVKAESASARDALNTELLNQQQEAFRRATPEIIGSYMRAGVLNSSGLDNAIARQMGELEKQRQGFVANAAYNDAIRAQGYNRQDFVNANANAFQQFLNQNQNLYNNNQANQARFYNTGQDLIGRSREIEDYGRQQNDYQRYIDQQNTAARRASQYQLAGALLGAGIQGAGYYYGNK